jgi:hypothetical protein
MRSVLHATTLTSRWGITMRFKPILSAATGLVLLGGAVATLTIPTTAFAQQGHRESADERHACQVATEFAKSAFGGADKSGTLVADNFEWRGDPRVDMRKGKDNYIQQRLARANRPRNPQIPFRISAADVLSCTAYGAKGDILVLQSRRDHLTSPTTGKLIRYEPLAAFYRVNPKTWLVEEWLDAPINPTQPLAGGPGGAPGGPPAAGAPPAGPAGGPPPGGAPPAGP